MLVIDKTATQEALEFPILIESLKTMFIRGCVVPPRHVHEIQAEPKGTALIMPAWTEDYFGIKTVNIFPQNSSRGLPGLFSAYTLFSARTGELLAQMDGNVVTSRRTAAASALAASYVALRQSKKLLVVGAGRVGTLLPSAYRAVLDIQEVLVWDRNQAAAKNLVEELNDGGLRAHSSPDLESLVGMADVVSCATLATRPVVKGKWLALDAHLDLIGSFTPEMREADDDAFVGAEIFVDTAEALEKSGELLRPIANGVFSPKDVAGTLAELCRGSVLARQGVNRRTVFKSVGTALEDLAAAIQVYEYWKSKSEHCDARCATVAAA
ncbi:ornithine cyclodeaminase family protein [Variovorax sp. VNK109]|jgi:ornithine cyclodeaminase/alanine dehydrogenase-like protein (mu-crystallin family)|uniref:ornithine cyclodeaminase family protein n=1 Tax=Variovorax sp. VNK109 TaxID=3400919 RepID=UPI003C120F1C